MLYFATNPPAAHLANCQAALRPPRDTRPPGRPGPDSSRQAAIDAQLWADSPKRPLPLTLIIIIKYMEPIGTMIKEELERQERSVSWLARKLSCDRSNVYRLFQKNSIDTALLQRLSVILNRDFFSELSFNLQSRRGKEEV